MKRILFTIILTGYTLCMYAQIPTNGLVGHWPFTGNANDESGNGHNGTVSGALLVTDRFGNANSAYQFDGIDDYIAIAPSSLVDGAGAISLSLWIKRDALDANGLPIHTGNQGRFGVHAFPDTMSVNVTTNSTYSGGSFTEFSTPNVYYKQVEWTHFVLRYDGDSLQLFVNNKLKASVFAEGVLYTPQSSYLAFGVYMLFGNPNHGYYKGLLDDVILYNRALTDIEIADLYYDNVCQVVTYETVYDTLITNVYDTIANYNIPDNGLVGYWPFIGNANDESGFNNHGVVNGAVLTNDRFGNPKNAYQFSAMSNITTTFAGVSGNGDRAISFWAKVEGNETGGHLMHYGSNIGGQAITIGLFPETSVHLDINNSTVSHVGAKINDGKWHHYLYIYSTQFGSSLDGLRIYQDGKLLTTINGSYNYSAYNINTGTADLFSIGATSYPVEGAIDDIRFYDRVLNNSEIQNLYAETKYFETIYDTLNVSVFDTTYVTVSDTTFINVSDTTFINVSDTTFINVSDTTFINVSDTTFINVSDTTFININDTTYITVYDTIMIEQYISVTDTLIIDYTITGLKKNLNNMIKVYPNPTNDILIIANSDYSQMSNYSIVILNISGQELFRSKINQAQFEIDLRTFGGKGLYLLRIFNSGGTLEDTRKLLLR